MSVDRLNSLIPEAWELRKIKTVAQVRTSNVDKRTEQGETPVRLCNYTDVYYSDTIHDASDFLVASASQKEIRRFRLRRGDVLLTKDSESWDDIAVPAHVARDFEDVLCGYHLALVRPRKNQLHGRFLFYCYRTPLISDQLSLRANGITRFGLSQDALRGTRVPLPPLPTQQAIASFLDRETRQIDTLIEKKRRLLDLLQEKRNALITRAVTRGLDPDVPLKDSGVEWMGEIPESWRAVPIKRVARLASGHTPSRSEPDYWIDCTIPWITLSDVGQLRREPVEYLYDTKEKISEVGLRNSAAELLPEGTVVLSRTASVGFSTIMGRPMATTQDFANWVCGDLILPEFLLYVFRGMKQEFSRIMMGSTHQTIYMPAIRALTTPLPPISEQEQIVAHIRESISGMDRMRDTLTRSISLLQEYRSALISAAVTGKIDVRDKIPA